MEGHRHALFAAERRGVHRVDAGRAVGHVELLAVGREAPALARIAVVADFAQFAVFQRIDVRRVRLPGELEEFVAHAGDPLAELRAGQTCQHVGPAGLGIDGLYARFAVLSRSLPQQAVVVIQPLRVGCRRVGIGRRDAVGVRFRLGLHGRRGLRLCAGAFGARRRTAACAQQQDGKQEYRGRFHCFGTK